MIAHSEMVWRQCVVIVHQYSGNSECCYKISAHYIRFHPALSIFSPHVRGVNDDKPSPLFYHGKEIKPMSFIEFSVIEGM